MGKKRLDRRNFRREAAEKRQAARNIMTPQEQLDRLDRMLGKGKGAVKERARLAEIIRKAAGKAKEDAKVEK
jgi:hypothetical protein